MKEQNNRIYEPTISENGQYFLNRINYPRMINDMPKTKGPYTPRNESDPFIKSCVPSMQKQNQRYDSRVKTFY